MTIIVSVVAGFGGLNKLIIHANYFQMGADTQLMFRSTEGIEIGYLGVVYLNITLRPISGDDHR